MAQRRPFPYTAALAHVLTVLLSAFLILTGVSLTADDRALFGIEAVNGAYVYVVAGFLGILGIRFEPVRLPALIALTLATLGRAVTLVVLGSPDLARRVTELGSGLGWAVLWVAGLLGYVGARWSEALRSGQEVAGVTLHDDPPV